MIQNFILLAIAFVLYIEIENLVARILVSIHEMATQPNMILNWYAKFIENHLGTYWSKPFFACPACMVSVYWIIPITLGGILTAFIINPIGLVVIPFGFISGFSISIKATQLALEINRKRNEVILSEKEIDEQKYAELV